MFLYVYILSWYFIFSTRYGTTSFYTIQYLSKNYAKHHRFQPNLTKAEALFWNIVLKHDKTGYRFLRQKIINSFILDFYCSKLRLAIEIDGWYHQWQEVYDRHRTDILRTCGIKVIRYSNDDIEHRLDWIILDLHEQMKTREEELI